ncbi:hypothetical protein [Saccharothrix coeruleofusca]|uniref:Uncharacterized protein n=1 Tax=Saccharothrix coeruleofusca TaxID=33919 RepID=A0A918AN85_9PSEU|nr:hypothetical protein [Saccharothrix coeruleofusca]MBP2339243.1 hypothetical protein [Saccharothrix coeruleofusca]GGP59144.1 hypothetical protein GCM10010185_34550 [Saccharothrix coeruleofusca]
MFFRWRSGRGAVTTCACEPEWPGLRASLDGHEVVGVPSPEGSSPMVHMLGLVARCSGCGAHYPHGWVVAG